jgi:hypothetical protein
MFEEVLNMVKQHLSDNPEIAQHIPAEQQEAIHQEIASHVTNAVTPPAGAEELLGSGGAGHGLLGGLGGDAGNGAAGGAGNSMFGGLLGQLESAIGGGGTVASAVEGGLVSSLASKFGLSPAATGAIAGALPGLLQKFMAHRQAGA